MQSIPELTKSSSFIFSGTVVEHGKSTVPAVHPSDKLVVVRLDRPLRVDPVLGDLQGKLITVLAKEPGSLSPGQKAVFFTNSWVHGRGIAVREVEHMDVGEEDNVSAAVAQLPQAHLTERLKQAVLVVDAEVANTRPGEKQSRDRNSALWAAAELKVKKVLSGQPRESTVVYFPTAEWPPWRKAPRFTEHQKGIFILHAPAGKHNLSEAALGPDSLVALDPADFQPESQLSEVKKMLAALKREGANQ